MRRLDHVGAHLAGDVDQPALDKESTDLLQMGARVGKKFFRRRVVALDVLENLDGRLAGINDFCRRRENTLLAFEFRQSDF